MQNHKLGILSKNEHQIFSVTFWVIRKKYPHAYVWVKIDKVSLCLEWTSVALDSGSGSQKMVMNELLFTVYRGPWRYENKTIWQIYLEINMFSKRLNFFLEFQCLMNNYTNIWLNNNRINWFECSFNLIYKESNSISP